MPRGSASVIRDCNDLCRQACRPLNYRRLAWVKVFRKFTSTPPPHSVGGSARWFSGSNSSVAGGMQLMSESTRPRTLRFAVVPLREPGVLAR